MHLSEIWIYPIKSLPGIRMDRSVVGERGLEYDRRWMLVDEHGTFITQRKYPKMALLDVALSENGLELTSRMEPEERQLIPFRRISDETLIVKIWKDAVAARTVSDEADRWLSRQLGLPVRIVEMPELTKRRMNPRDSDHGELISFTDDFPYLLISEASLTDLNSRLEQKVSMQRFRPNFVVAGTEPYAEDSWKQIRISGVPFTVVKPCERCILINVHPDTAEKGPEPLKTLATYRKINKKIIFGQNLIRLEDGIVSEGDAIQVV